MIGGILLGVGSCLLCKWNKNKRKQKKVTPTLGNVEGNNDNKHENLTEPTKENVDQGQKGIPPINLQEILQVPENAIVKK